MATKQQKDISISLNDNKDYNNSMDKRPRWTVLETEEKAIKLVKKFAKKNGYTVGKAISELIYKAERIKKDEA